MESHEIWQNVFKNVRDNALLYLTSPRVQEKYKDPATKIDIWVNDVEHLVNAQVKKTGPNTYEICIFAGLVAALEQECDKVLREFPKLFEKVDRADSKKMGMAHSALLYIWLDFVCCHEWAHAICGHLDFDDRVAEWYEDEVSGSPQSTIEELISQHLEAEADSYAAKFSLARFSTYWERLSDDLYGERDGYAALCDYIMAMLLFFRFFERSHTKSPNQKKTHPIPFNRAFIMLSFCQGEYANVPGLPMISAEEKDTFFGLAAVKFYVQILNLDVKEYIVKSLQAAQFMEGVDKTLAALEMKRFRLFK